MNAVTISTQASNFLSAFEGAVDQFCAEGKRFDISDMIQQSKLRDIDLTFVQSKLQRKVEELELVVIDADEQLMEGYSNLTKAQQRDLLSMYYTVMERKVARTRKTKRALRETIVSMPTVSAPVEEYDAVFSYCEKYRVIRAFLCNVKLQGHDIKCDTMIEVKFAKDVNVADIATMSLTDATTFVYTGKDTSKKFKTLRDLDLHTVVKF